MCVCVCAFNSFSLAPSITANHTNLHGNHMQFVVIYAQSEQLFLLIRQRWLFKKKKNHPGQRVVLLRLFFLIIDCRHVVVFRRTTDWSQQIHTHKTRIFTCENNYCLCSVVALKKKTTKNLLFFFFVFRVHLGEKQELTTQRQ